MQGAFFFNKSISLQRLINEFLQYLIQNGAEIIVSACTDLSIFIEQSNTYMELKYIDTMDILARKVVSHYSELTYEK